MPGGAVSGWGEGEGITPGTQGRRGGEKVVDVVEGMVWGVGCGVGGCGWVWGVGGGQRYFLFGCGGEPWPRISLLAASYY